MQSLQAVPSGVGCVPAGQAVQVMPLGPISLLAQRSQNVECVRKEQDSPGSQGFATQFCGTVIAVTCSSTCRLLQAHWSPHLYFGRLAGEGVCGIVEACVADLEAARRDGRERAAFRGHVAPKDAASDDEVTTARGSDGATLGTM